MTAVTVRRISGHCVNSHFGVVIFLEGQMAANGTESQRHRSKRMPQGRVVWVSPVQHLATSVRADGVRSLIETPECSTRRPLGPGALRGPVGSEYDVQENKIHAHRVRMKGDLR